MAVFIQVCFFCKCVSVILSLSNSVSVVGLHAFLFFLFIILTSSEIPLEVKRFKSLIEGAADLADRY